MKRIRDGVALLALLAAPVRAALPAADHPVTVARPQRPSQLLVTTAGEPRQRLLLLGMTAKGSDTAVARLEIAAAARQIYTRRLPDDGGTTELILAFGAETRRGDALALYRLVRAGGCGPLDLALLLAPPAAAAQGGDALIAAMFAVPPGAIVDPGD